MSSSYFNQLGIESLQIIYFLSPVKLLKILVRLVRKIGKLRIKIQFKISKKR